MKRSLLALAVLTLGLLPQAQLRAWSGAGHMVIAAEAYRQLSPALKSKVDALLKAHPEYERWKASFTSDSPGADLELFIFMRASTWPDEIRRHGSGYDHPKWHYVDYPLRPPSFPLEPDPDPGDDVLFGIAESEKILFNTKAVPEVRAAHLAWLVHLVGDIHQPLHCASFFNDTYPKGDKGGNEFYVSPASRGIRLHSFWDGLLGTSGKPQAHLNYAIQLQAEYPRKSLKEIKKDKSPQAWSLEGRSLAVEKAYLSGELKGSTHPDDAPALPEGYTKSAKAVAEKQAALAGYRLADALRKYLK